MSSQNKAIGGYFDLELPKNNELYYPDALKFHSARSAYYSLLIHCKPNRVWMPYYICDSMLAPLVKAGIDVAFYSIKSDLTMADKLDLKPDEKLFYVNYFGLCSAYEDELLKTYDPNQVILDHSQAFFCKPKNSLATIYSPRKFFGVPDGGLLITSQNMIEPREVDVGSLRRTTHLLKRLAGEPEDGYLDYKKNENSLNDFEPKKMSILTEKLLNNIDYASVKKARNDNFLYFHERLNDTNLFNINIGSVDGPMGYPYLVKTTDLKKLLISSRVFIPTYWSEVKSRPGVSDLEKNLVEKLNLIPCDQRYGANELNVIMGLINEY